MLWEGNVNFGIVSIEVIFKPQQVNVEKRRGPRTEHWATPTVSTQEEKEEQPWEGEGASTSEPRENQEPSAPEPQAMLYKFNTLFQMINF